MCLKFSQFMNKAIQPLMNLLGIEEQEALVYVALLELGEATIQQIAQKSGVKRTSIYNFLPTMREKGLIIQSKKHGGRMYEAINPKQLVDIGKSRLLEIETVIPELSALYKGSVDKPKVSYFEGIDGIKDAYTDMLETKQPIVSYEDIEYLKKMLPKNYYDYLPAERAKRNIPLRTISKDSSEARKFTEDDQKLIRQTKFIATEHSFKTEINIYGNKALMISFREDRPFATIIEDADIINTLRTSWNELWERL